MSDLPNPLPLADYWRQQVNSWKNSGKSQAKFCQANELSYHPRILSWTAYRECGAGCLARHDEEE